MVRKFGSYEAESNDNDGTYATNDLVYSSWPGYQLSLRRIVHLGSLSIAGGDAKTRQVAKERDQSDHPIEASASLSLAAWQEEVPWLA